MLPEPTEKKSGTCRNFRKFAEEIFRGSRRSPRRLGYSLKSSQVRELDGSKVWLKIFQTWKYHQRNVLSF
ncbi:unnamed protein product [Musa acuminata subsp. malaccensis]|uniref:(wild Malaysian banana) hypothetical protein n=1 Tax=Musa acuminata subsp. malaccensis TaxID=214687 RepID=A0A804IQ64_MUSAM|nr:unnamed protein product [Musa acuminata subsp. malaccensis]